MDKGVIIKFTGVVIALFIVTIATIYFLYPYLNEQGYQEAVASVEEQEEPLYEFADNNPVEVRNEQLVSLRDTCLQDENYAAIIDSLEQVNREYEQKLAELTEQVSAAQTVTVAETTIPETNTINDATENVSKEEFFDRVKSFLNLDEEELAPIAAKLSDDELVRLYRGSGNMQREKLLRSLKPERAATLMKEVMS